MNKIQKDLLTKKREHLDNLFKDTPRTIPETRQLRRAEMRELLKERASIQKKADRKDKRSRKHVEVSPT